MRKMQYVVPDYIYDTIREISKKTEWSEKEVIVRAIEDFHKKLFPDSKIKVVLKE